MITGINLMETKEHVSKYDTGAEKTVWKIGVLDSNQMTVAMANETRTLETMGMVVRFGLKGFENFRGADGKLVQFSTEPRIFGSKTFHVVSEDIMKIIPTQVITELGIEILKLGKLSEDEAKN